MAEQHPIPSHRRFQNYTGRRFGRLVVIEYAGRYPSGGHRWRCVCDCGHESIVGANGLRDGNSRSCGCLQRESPSRLFTTHGLSKTPAYRVWSCMMTRCYNENYVEYHLYGGRGIRVCERWHDFKNFVADMGERPSRKHSIDRYPDANGNYEPGNCRWATASDQATNRRSTHWITCNGRTLCIRDWARETGIPAGLISARINRLGWSPEKAITQPVA